MGTRSSNSPMPARDVALVASFTGVVAALGLMPPVQPLGLAVPITAQSMGVMLAGSILGSRRGGSSLLLFVLLVALGLPLLAGGRGGLAVFASPSVGYVVGFPVAAYLVGRLTELRTEPRAVAWGVCANIIGGVVALYALGITGTVLVTDLPLTTVLTGALAFVPGDLIKAGAAALVASGVHRAYPGLVSNRPGVVTLA